MGRITHHLPGNGVDVTGGRELIGRIHHLGGGISIIVVERRQITAGCTRSDRDFFLGSGPIDARHGELVGGPVAGALAAVGSHTHIVHNIGGEVVQGYGSCACVHCLPVLSTDNPVLESPGVLAFRGVPGNGGGTAFHFGLDVGDHCTSVLQHHIVDDGGGLRTTRGIVVPGEDEFLVTGVGCGNQDGLGGEFIHTVETGQVFRRQTAGLR